jgi:ELWxxDGT repeat protein
MRTAAGSLAATRARLRRAQGPRGSWPRDFATLRGRLFFNAETAAAGDEPWVTDGTRKGTRLFKDQPLGRLRLLRGLNRRRLRPSAH